MYPRVSACIRASRARAYSPDTHGYKRIHVYPRVSACICLYPFCMCGRLRVGSRTSVTQFFGAMRVCADNRG